MVFPTITALYAALLALVYLGLSAWVVMRRTTNQVMLGEGGDTVLTQRIRAHANFGEYIPLILILDAMLEGAEAKPALMHVLLLPLLIARILHPFGMIAPDKSMQQKLCRGLAAVVTWLAMLAAAILLLLRLA